MTVDAVVHVQVLNEAQMLGIPLHRSSSSSAARRQRRSSSSPVSHRSSPVSRSQVSVSRSHLPPVSRSPAAAAAAAAVKPYTVTMDRARRQRGSSTPSRLDHSDPVTDSKNNTNKFNIRSLLAKIAAGRASPSTRRRHDADGRHDADRAPLTRRSVSQHHDQQTRHSKRSLSASAPLRRARINDSTSSISGVSTISQYYPSTVAAAQRTAAGAARVGTSLRSSAGSVWTTAESLPDSVSNNSLASSVFSLKSSSTGASPALWTPFTPPSAHTGPPRFLSVSLSHSPDGVLRLHFKLHFYSSNTSHLFLQHSVSLRLKLYACQSLYVISAALHLAHVAFYRIMFHCARFMFVYCRPPH